MNMQMNVIEKESRPWGCFEVLYDEPQYKLKRITVDPGHRLSYQKHEKRSEKWTVVIGSGLVVLDGREIPIEKGSVIDIPCQTKHRIQNTGKVPLVFFEIQLGDYFGEDDITRYDDDYNRI